MIVGCIHIWVIGLRLVSHSFFTLPVWGPLSCHVIWTISTAPELQVLGNWAHRLVNCEFTITFAGTAYVNNHSRYGPDVGMVAEDSKKWIIRNSPFALSFAVGHNHE